MKVLNRLRTGLVLWVLLVASLAPRAIAAGKDRPAWDREAFSIPAAELLRLADSEKQADVPVVILKAEDHISYDRQGRETHKRHIIYRIQEASAIDEWSSVGLEWSPWHQQRPEIRARVIAAGGKEHRLDPATITEAPASDGDPDLYGDGRSLEAPLPAVSAGSVVEQETIVRDTKPYFEAGDVRTVYFSWPVPVRIARVIVEAPSSVPLRYALRLAPQAGPVKEEKDGLVRYTFEVKEPTPLASIPANLPFDVPIAPYMAVSTGASWASLASRYHQIVEERLTGPEVTELVKAAGDSRLPVLTRIDRVLARLRTLVRYTGVELGSAAILPQPPNTTLARRFGDCKDQAMLLVAALKPLKIEARVALLKAGLSQDVEPGLPGMGAFNHAIVVIPGNPSIWIDPTDPFARAGDLPLQDQGRFALIADPATSSLTKTPESTAADNREVEIREIRLAENGPGTVIESTQLYGTFERQLRSDYSSLAPKKLREHITGYAKNAYSAKELGEMRLPEFSDLSRPFEMVIEAKKASVGSTSESDAAAALSPSLAAERLPKAFREGKDEERQLDFLLPAPMTVERRYKVIPPPGYVAKPLPESEEKKWGPVSESRQYKLESDGSVSATFRFITSRRRITPDEFRTIRSELKKPQATENVVIEFDQAGEAHLAAGRVNEAITEFRRLAALHPKKAGPLTQISRALLAGGLGEESRKLARKAIEIDPSSAAAHRTLGWVLQHDLIGRRFSKGFDHAGALSAYRKAKQLDPQDAITRGDLAILLEHDESGRRYSPKANLDQAIEEYRSIKNDLNNDRLDGNLVAVLLRAKRWAEIRPLAKDSEAVQQKDTVLLVATTMIEGPEAALEESRRLSGNARRAALAGAARSLLDFREYKRAIPLFEAASAGAPNAQQLRTLNDVLKKTQRWEELKFPDSDPESVVKKFLVEIVAGKGEIRSLLGADIRQEFDRNPRQTSMVQFIARLMAERLKEPGLSLDTAVDLSFGRMLTFKEGDDASGYRIRIAPDGTAGKRDQVYLVVKEENAYRLLTAGFYVAPAGKEALRRADRGDLAGAKRILDWIRELQKPEGGDDPLQGPAFAHLWPVDTQEEAGLIRLSAAALLAEDPDFAAGAIEILEKDRATQTSDETKLWVERALAEAYASTKNWKQLERVSAGLFEKKPASTEAARFLVTALRRQSKFAEAEAVANRLAAKRPNSEEAVRLLSETAVDKNDLAAARRHVETLIERGDANSQDYNLLAWMSLFGGGPSEKALETAQKANDLSGGVSYGALHTQAVLLAELGRSAEAYQTILKAISFSGEEEPIPTDWYVFARLAENYGYPDVARTLYLRAKPAKPEEEERHLSTWELAQKRMATLPSATVVKGKARK